MINVIKYVVLKIALMGAPEMSFRDDETRLAFEELERENKGQECFPVIEFCRDWARLMQKELAAGNMLEDSMIRACENLAASELNNYDGGYPALAKRILVQHWYYGRYLQDYE